MRQHFITSVSQTDFSPANDKGSALVICMMVIVVLTTIGVMAIQTSVVETRIATNEQRYEEDFNIAEGGAVEEAGDVGHASPDTEQWYEISDPDLRNQTLVPPTEADYDPGDDIAVVGTFPDAFEALPSDQQATDKRFWPHGNLLNDTNAGANSFDYAYLVTYLGPGKGKKGFDVSKFVVYQFKINGAASRTALDVELGGLKIGPKI